MHHFLPTKKGMREEAMMASNSSSLEAKSCTVLLALTVTVVRVTVVIMTVRCMSVRMFVCNAQGTSLGF